MVRFSRWQVVLVVAICVFGVVFAAPNLLDRQTVESLPDWLPSKQINLGLDLQGGSHLLLEVDTGVVIRERLEADVDAVRAVLREARIPYAGLGVSGNGVAVRILDPDRLDEAADLLRDLDAETVVTEGADGRLTMELTEAAIEQRQRSAVSKTVEVIRRRIDETGVREPTIQPQGDTRILVQLPGIDDPERMKKLIEEPAKMTFHLVDTEMSAAEARTSGMPPGSRIIPSADERTASGRPLEYLVKRRVVVSGENLVDAQPTFDPQTNEPVVSFRFDTIGGQRFGRVTTENVGGVLAIVLDNEVISAPRIREPILGGSGVISGSFTVESANDLALLLRAGALPAPLTILEERTVGPGLGADSIAAGMVAGIIGLTGVVLFMAVYYGLFGVFAASALLINIMLIAAALSTLQATLTLPGIAGIVLTIGMAVDANVLIFERIREEVRNGRTPVNAIDTGYSRALSTIIDANVTTFFAALLLYIFGSGPVRGFAVTLAIGIMTSVFTAVMLTRLFVVAWLRQRRRTLLPV